MTYSKKELKKYLKGLVKDPAGLPNFSFEYHSGHTSYHTRLRIHVTSERIEHRKISRGIEVDSPDEAQATKVRETNISTEKVMTFVEALLKKNIWDLENCTDRAAPDTPLLTFVILDNGNPIFKQEIWQICRNDDTRAKELIRALSALVPLDWTPP